MPDSVQIPGASTAEPALPSRPTGALQLEGTRRLLIVLLGMTFAVGVGFIAAIVSNATTGVGWHEVAGLTLLALLVGALWAALRLRFVGNGPLVRVTVALVSLILAGATGATLASGILAARFAGLPLIPLAVVLVAVGDGIRVTLAVRPSLASNQAEDRSAPHV